MSCLRRLRRLGGVFGAEHLYKNMVDVEEVVLVPLSEGMAAVPLVGRP
jgi:hypothetical protein